MDRRNVLKRALLLAIPIMIQNGITNAVGLVDHIMVGSLGTEAMTAVSIVGQLLFVFTLALFGGMSGPGIYTAQFYGQGNTEGVRASTRMKAIIAIVCTAAGIAILLLGENRLIHLYLHGESAEIDAALTLSHAKDYLHIMLLGLPALAVTQIYSSSLRETGDSVKPMAAGIVSVTADILFNWLLIYGSLGFPRLGVRGAAIATVIARYLEMGVLVIWAYARRKRHPFIEGLWRTLKIPAEISRKIITKTIPIFINEFLWAAGIAVLTQCYSTRGLEVVAGINISNVLCNLLNVVFVALGYSVGILVGQSLGAEEYDRAKKESFTLTWFTALLCVGLTAILIALSGVFPQLYDTTDAVRQLATEFIIITALFFPVQGILNSLYFTLRSGGKTLVTFAFDSVFSWVVTVPLAVILCMLTDLPILAVYAIVQAVDVIKIIIGAIMIRKGIWITNLTQEFAENGSKEVSD
ncbi:MAG: MATE family efflux transporter [Ruminococcus sp.]|nr:MATE family efflux transporter [Ruminococcus sp.]